MIAAIEKGWKARTGLIAFVLCLAFGHATAGSIDEVNLVIADLGEPEDHTIAEAIRGSVNAESPECWAKGSSGVIYIKRHPPGITDALLRLALLNRDRRAQDTLSKRLLSFADEGVRGLDGAVVYINKPSPRFISFTAIRKHIAIETISDITVRRDIELSFCAVKPDIVRKP